MLTQTRPFYFGAGPAALPLEVLERVQAAVIEWKDGLSILELGHRTLDFGQILSQTEALLRKLLSLPSEYVVLFVGGSTRAHFGAIPLHFLKESQTAGYWITGHWSKLAYEEAVRLKSAWCVDGVDALFPSVLPDETAYLYLTPNETIQGIRVYPDDLGELSVPLVADMTSCLLTEPIPIESYGLVFAGVQKNMGIPGMTVLILSPEMMSHMSVSSVPKAWNYEVLAKHHSLYATPPTFNIYVLFEMLTWLDKQGGVDSVYQQNLEKSTLLYEYIDQSHWYENHVPALYRSLVNIPFTLGVQDKEALFVEEAKKRGLLGVQGHQSIGGLRVSLYNAMPLVGVKKLIEFMQDFMVQYG